MIKIDVYYLETIFLRHIQHCFKARIQTQFSERIFN